MAEEKKSMDISTYYAKQEIAKFEESWKVAQDTIAELIAIEEPDGDTLSSIIKTIDGLKKSCQASINATQNMYDPCFLSK